MFERLSADISALFASGTVGSYIAIGLYALAAVLIVVGFFKGFARGVANQTVRLITVIGAAVLSVVLCCAFYPKLSEWCGDKTLAELWVSVGLDKVFVNRFPLLDLIGDISGKALIYLSVIPTVFAVLPLLFGLFFMILSALMLIVHALICHMVGFLPYRNSPLTRFLGGAVGLVQGLIVSVLVLLPVFGITSYIAQAVDELPEDNKVSVVYHEYIEVADKSVLSEITHRLGGDYILETLANVTIDDKAVNAKLMAKNFAHMYSDVTELKAADRWSALTAADKANITDLIERTDADDTLRYLTAELLHKTAVTIADHENMLPFEEPFRTFARECVEVLASVTEESLKNDLMTLADVYFAISDSGALAELKEGNTKTAAAKLALTRTDGMSTMEYATARLDENEHTRPLIPALVRFGLSLLAEDGAADFTTLANTLRGNLLSDADKGDMTDEEYAAALSDSLKTFCADYAGIDISDAAAASAAALVAAHPEYVENASAVTDAAVAAILARCFFTAE